MIVVNWRFDAVFLQPQMIGHAIANDIIQLNGRMKCAQTFDPTTNITGRTIS